MSLSLFLSLISFPHFFFFSSSPIIYAECSTKSNLYFWILQILLPCGISLNTRNQIQSLYYTVSILCFPLHFHYLRLGCYHYNFSYPLSPFKITPLASVHLSRSTLILPIYLLDSHNTVSLYTQRKFEVFIKLNDKQIQCHF